MLPEIIAEVTSSYKLNSYRFYFIKFKFHWNEPVTTKFIPQPSNNHISKRHHAALPFLCSVARTEWGQKQALSVNGPLAAKRVNRWTAMTEWRCQSIHHTVAGADTKANPSSSWPTIIHLSCLMVFSVIWHHIALQSHLHTLKLTSHSN